MSLTVGQFITAAKRAQNEYDATRKGIEGKPIRLREQGGDQLLKRIVSLGTAWLGVNQAVDAYRQFQSDIANVESLGVENIDQLKESVLEIGNTTPIALGNLTAGLYDVVSAGVDAEHQISVLESSARSAKAGLAETTDALGLGSAVIKGFRKEWENFDSIMDQAFQTVKLGQTTFSELAASAQRVIPNFAALNIESSELFGAFATLTGVTGSTAEVGTQLRAITTELARPTANLNALIKEQTGLSVEAAVKQKGLAGILKILADETQGSAAEMNKLFSSSEAITGLLALTTSQYDTFIDKTNQMTTATGAMSDAFEVQSQTIDSQIQLLKNQFEVLTIGIIEGTVPALNTILTPASSLVQKFNELDTFTQQTILTLGTLTVALFRLVPAITAVRAGAAGLSTLLGPAGILIAGIGLAITALNSYAGASDEASLATGILEDANLDLAASFDAVTKAALKELGTSSTTELIKLREELNATIEESIARQAKLNETINSLQPEDLTLGRKFDLDNEKQFTQATIEEARARLAAIDRILNEREEIESAAAGALTEKDRKEIDKRRAYEFESNRITLAEYVAYLESRRASLADALGAESVEYLTFVDKLSGLQAQLELAVIANEGIEIIPPEQVDILDQVALKAPDLFQELQEIRTEFADLGLADLQSEFTLRTLMLENNMLITRQLYGEESAAYRQLLDDKKSLDENYQAARVQLEADSQRAIIALGAGLMTAFQGQSKTLFAVGKGLSVAQATINAYEAASRAYKDYPFPFNIGVAAIQLGLGLGQVGKIRATQFQPKGKALGGLVRDEDIVRSAITPAGEDGIIGIQLDEFVVNKKATQQYLPILRQINAGTFRPEVGAFQNGGAVTAGSAPAPSSAAPGSDDTASILRDILHEVSKPIRSDFDWLRFYRDTYPEYERNRSRNRL